MYFNILPFNVLIEILKRSKGTDFYKNASMWVPNIHGKFPYKLTYLNDIVQTNENSLSVAFLNSFVNNHGEIADALLALGANVNIQNEYGETTLMFAAKFGLDKHVSYLLNSGADVNLKDIDGNDVFYYAKLYDNNNAGHIIKLLTEHSQNNNKIKSTVDTHHNEKNKMNNITMNSNISTVATISHYLNKLTSIFW